MRCYVCGKKFRGGELVVPISRYAVDEKRGDSVGRPQQYAHAKHLRALVKEEDS